MVLIVVLSVSGAVPAQSNGDFLQSASQVRTDAYGGTFFSSYDANGTNTTSRFGDQADDFAESSNAAPLAEGADQPLGANGQGRTTEAASPNATATVDDGWHLAVSPYLWLPGVHGTVGALGRDVSVHVSPGDLLSYFRFGLMGLVEPRYERLVLPLDLMWVRLEDNKSIPLPDLGGVLTAKMKGTEFLLTQKGGFRIIDQEKLKIDALAGFRYWHFGESLQFTPSVLGLNYSRSQNWVDPLVGGKTQMALSPKIVATIAGDVGGWGVASQMDYQVVGLLGYRIKPTWTLQAGYRYLYVDYTSGGATLKLATSGVGLGLSVDLK